MLTERKIRDAKPGERHLIIWDDKVKGLGVRIAKGGTKTFIIDYRTGGKQRRATLARTSEISLKDARERAGRELAAIRAGDAGILERRKQLMDEPTVADGIARFFDDYVPGRMRDGRMSANTRKNYLLQAKKDLLPALGKLRVADVTRHDIEAMIKRLHDKPTQKNRVLAFASRLFNLFEHWEYRPQHTNPTRGIDRAREQARDRVLSAEELSALSAALNDAKEKRPSSVAAITFAALTGLRISEVLSMQWDHVDFENGRAVLPETKTGRRWHDLPATALQILATLPKINAWVFTVGRDAPLMYRTVRKNFMDIATEAGLQDVRLHDLRRTVMTHAAASGVGTHVLRDLLGHKTTAMADRYIRAIGNPVRDAREQVGSAIAGMMEHGCVES